ncbi:MAG: helix-turn-helix domain-containing protein [Steroidobacteraceae bacterium]
MSIRAAARRLKVAPPAITNWRKRFREQRLAGLPISSNPADRAHMVRMTLRRC